MTTAGFWKTDWFLGVAVVVSVVLFNRLTDLIPSLERKAYDLGVVATARTPSDKIAVVAIDEQSLANLGRWPWSRDVLAKMTDALSAGKARVIAYTVLFSEPQVDAGYTYVTRLLEMAGAAGSAEPAMAADPNTPAAGATPGQFVQFVTLLKEAEQALNTDRRLADSFTRAENVVPMTLFELGEPRGKPDKPLPEYVTKNSLPKAGRGLDDGVLPTRKADYPIEIIGKAAAAAWYADVEKKNPGGEKASTLQWTPLEADASPDGVLGYTRGTWIYSGTKKDGSAQRVTGYYVTEWKRQSDGKYKFVLDIGGADGP